MLKAKIVFIDYTKTNNLIVFDKYNIISDYTKTSQVVTVT